MPVVSVPVTADSVAPAGEETGFAPDVTVGPASAEPSTALPAAAEVPVGVADVQVELSFTEDCWTEISDSEGERLFYGLGSAGARSRFNATLPISIFFGNAGGVDLTVNGDRYPIPTGSRQGNLARFVIAEPGP
jgi:cytoskeleton protein RodZ